MKTLLLFLLLASALSAETVYLKPSAFITSHVGNNPQAQALELDSTRQGMIKKLLGKKYFQSRIQYWRKGEKVCFILEEIGKTRPITTGFCVEKGKIKEMRVLIYRESHGWEVEKSFFRKQLKGVHLNGTSLSKTPGNIAGATLSVNALTNLSKVALYLGSQV